MTSCKDNKWCQYTSNMVVITCKVYTSSSPLSLQQSGVETWQCALLPVEAPAHVGSASTPIDTMSRCVGGNPLPWPWTSPSGGPIHMLSNRRGQHIPLTQCSTVLRKVLLQASSSLAYVTSWSLVTRDSLDHSLSSPLWNIVLGSITYYHCMKSYFVL